MPVPISFKIENKIKGKLGRAGILKTAHGEIQTPAFVAVGTQATVKSLTPEQIREAGCQVVLANTYHLHLKPGEKIVKRAGGINKFMNWNGPTMTDSGGFQVFSLGRGIGREVSKVGGDYIVDKSGPAEKNVGSMAKITEEGVEFRSVVDGSLKKISPEKSIQIQHDIGADIIFAFDECTSPEEALSYQTEAMERTHRWATRSLLKHIDLSVRSSGKKDLSRPALFGIVQGGRSEVLRKKSAEFTASLNVGGKEFDGYGIGGSFDKKDIGTAVRWVNKILPEEKPRHLLGIGDPIDLFEAVENGCDLFDCVSPTRLARNGALYTETGRINILNSKYRADYGPIDKKCRCYTCLSYSKVYLSHLYRSKEILANTLGSIHNLYFINSLVGRIRQSIMESKYPALKKNFLGKFKV